ncbi:SDR family NAD(P)-dependent oxidoreductase [Bianquea renquensis]|uniref:3-oxoacyl-ACP reductase FabG n=1 Tax=Bianquea renquensis TaxID=2763661 RepID=A0A926I0Z8_9FIRM|nr:3-oxoacyl-ACP reductase family protein [Bianquea renquensis]MBC8542750.1 3-oxoacyl-ACP reductase FabG [Bianquea renquensis]
MKLQEKTIVITGGTGGIGKAAVEALSERGANVVFTYLRHQEKAEQMVKRLSENGKRVRGMRVDCRVSSSVKGFVRAVLQEYGRIDVVINNAGIRKDRSLLYMSEGEWADVVDTNLTGAFYLTRACVPYLLKQQSGRIINISSISGLSGLTGQANYSASKAGLMGFTKALAKELAPYGISVNAIAPGAVETDMLKGLSASYLEELTRSVPMKRMCRPEETAKVIEFLADDEQAPDYLTGQTIVLDGGMGH